jgi:hypothetical protein
MAFLAADSLLVLDDYVPSGTPVQVQALQTAANRLIRGVANHAGRGRLRPDGTPRPPRPPRCLALVTGEDVPRGESLRARMLLLEFHPGDVDPERLTLCQQDAASGRYAQALAGYARWLAPQMPEVRRRLGHERERLRDRADGDGHLSRRSGIVADVLLGLHYLLLFAVAVGAIDQAEAERVSRDGKAAVLQAAGQQQAHAEDAEPAGNFLQLIAAALTAGRAHVIGHDGNVPPDPQRWGWRERALGHRSTGDHAWDPQGECIGWLQGDDLLLQPAAAFAVAARLGSDNGCHLALTPRSLWSRLCDQGHLASREQTRQRFTIRRVLQGSRPEVLHLRAEAVVGRPSQGADGDVDGERAVGVECAEDYSRSPFDDDGETPTLAATCLLRRCHDLGITLSIGADGDLVIQTSPGTDPATELQLDLQRHKAEVLALLARGGRGLGDAA